MFRPFRPADHQHAAQFNLYRDLVVPIVWHAIEAARRQLELPRWRRGDAELMVEEAKIKLATKKAQHNVASNTQLKHVSARGNGLTRAGLVWGAIREMFSRRVQVVHLKGGLQLPRLVPKHGHPIERRRTPNTDAEAAIYCSLPTAVPAFVVPEWVPCLLESCFGNLRHQRYMQPYAHLMQVFSHYLCGGGAGYEKATCIWLSCFDSILGGGALKELRGCLPICGLHAYCRLPNGTPGQTNGTGKHKIRLGRDQSHAKAVQELLPLGFCMGILAWFLTFSWALLP